MSEGQAYAMLVSAAVGDQTRFEAAWKWTSSHLLRPDGLMAWHWDSGQVVGAQPAADADLVTAFALFSASGRFHQPAWAAAAARMSSAILSEDVGQSSRARSCWPGHGQPGPLRSRIPPIWLYRS